MAIKIEVHYSEMQSTNVFQIVELYEDLHEWLIVKEYHKGGDSDFPEIYFWESRSQNMGKEYWIWWRLTKGFGSSSFVKRELDIDIHGVGIQDVEVMWNNQKLKANKGKLEFMIRGRIVFDPKGEWEKSFLGPFLETFWKRIYGPHFRLNKVELLADIAQLQDYIRGFFLIPQRGGKLEPFSPARGFERKDNF